MLPKELKAGDRVYPVLYVKASGRTSSVRIRDGKVVLRLSRFSRCSDMDRVTEKFLKWARKKLEKAGDLESLMPVYGDRGRVCTHNKVYEINVFEEDRANSGACLVNGYLIEIKIPFGQNVKVKFLAEKIIIKDQTPYLKQVLDELNELHLKVHYKLCRFKRMDSRFGSCSRIGNINIAYKTLFMPREVFRYVCLHELCHLKEMNHSNRFWALVSEAVPDYKDHEKWLRKNGFAIG